MVVSLLVVILLAGHAAAAQDDAAPTAGAPEPGYTATGDPLVGTAVSYVDEDGDEIGVLTVREVTDPFTRYGDLRAPDEGTRYVAVEVEVCATGGDLEVAGFDFYLQTVDGFLYHVTLDPREHALLPELKFEELRTGEELTGLLFYALPAEAELARVVWQPRLDRLLILADLRGE